MERLEVAHHDQVVLGVPGGGDSAEVTGRELLFFTGPVLTIEHLDDRKDLASEQLAMDLPRQIIAESREFVAVVGNVCLSREGDDAEPYRTVEIKALIYEGFEVRPDVSTSLA